VEVDEAVATLLQSVALLAELPTLEETKPDRVAETLFDGCDLGFDGRTDPSFKALFGTHVLEPVDVVGDLVPPLRPGSCVLLPEGVFLHQFREVGLDDTAEDVSKRSPSVTRTGTGCHVPR
jgi:hypothetical protein